jgi:anti-sigma B factor antagonist
LQQEFSSVLDIQVTAEAQIMVVTVQGRVDSSTAGQLGEALSGVIEEGFFQIVLDLGGVDYMSSAGLREMVSALKKVRARDGDMRIAQVGERVLEVLELSGLNTLLQFYDSPAEAVGSF